MHSLLRRLLPSALAVVVTAAVAVPLTWHLATAGPVGSGDELPEVPAGPRTRDALRQELRDQLPDLAGSVLLELHRSHIEPVAAGLAPGEYEVHLICGLMRRQGTVEELTIRLEFSSESWELTLPCPATPQQLHSTVRSPEPAGAVKAGVIQLGSRLPSAYLLLIQLVPTGAGR